MKECGTTEAAGERGYEDGWTSRQHDSPNDDARSPTRPVPIMFCLISDPTMPIPRSSLRPAFDASPYFKANSVSSPDVPRLTAADEHAKEDCVLRLRSSGYTG